MGSFTFFPTGAQVGKETLLPRIAHAEGSIADLYQLHENVTCECLFVWGQLRKCLFGQLWQITRQFTKFVVLFMGEKPFTAFLPESMEGML